MATIKKATKTITKVEPKKAEVVISTSGKKTMSKKSGVATADLKGSHVTNVKTIDEKAKKTVIVKKDSAKKGTVKIETKKAEAKKTEPKKTTTAKTTTAKKATTTKAATTKKATTAKTTTTKAAATKKTTTTKKATTAKTTTARKTATTKKAETMHISLHVQYAGRELSHEHITERCVENYIAAGNKKSSIKTLETYVKIEDNTAYYVVNSNYRGHVVLD